MTYCDSCGAKLPSDAHYCLMCGSPVNHFLDPEDIPVRSKNEGFFSGRIGRERFFGGFGFSMFPLMSLAVLWVVANTTTGLTSVLVYSVFLLLLLPAIVFSVAMNIGLTMRRCHDLGLNGLCAIFAYIPYVGLFFELFLLLKKGDAETNEYGPAPRAHRNLFEDFFNYDIHQTADNLRALK